MYTLVSTERLVGAERCTFDDSIGTEIVVDIPTQFFPEFTASKRYDIYFDTRTGPDTTGRLRLILHGVVYSVSKDQILMSFGGFLARITSESVGTVYKMSAEYYVSFYETEN